MSKRRIRLAGIVSAGLALSLAAPVRAADVTVTVGHNRIEPSWVTVEAGETVTFHNVDEMPGGHTIVADDGSFRSPPLAKGQEWKLKTDAPGAHPFHIEQHPNATGTLVVE